MYLKKKVEPFDIINILLLSLVSLVVMYPLWFTIVASVSSAKLVALGEVWLLPRGLNTAAYAATENIFGIRKHNLNEHFLRNRTQKPGGF